MLLQFQQKMDEKGEGEEIKQLADRPVVFPDLQYIFEAFVTIKSYCRDRNIRINDVLSYCDLNYLDDFYERAKILRYIKEMENFMILHLKDRKAVGT